MFGESKVREMVRRVVHRTLGIGGGAKRVPTKPMVTERDINVLPFGGQYQIPPGALITPLARQVAMDRKVTLVLSDSAEVVVPVALPQGNPGPAASTSSGPPPTPIPVTKGTVALAADHAGFELKEAIKAFLGQLGYTVMDCGTDSAESVDYPDFAYAAAQLVGQGKAWRAIIVNGAGIGSCMTANKVPGVRAAMCYDQASAINSREHNDANVLTLGAGMIGVNLAQQIVKVWLETPFGGGRHARRVNKIVEIERRFSR
ncbi:MAG: ribose 5-phosphate isomerase B [Anaerolineales bacterium]